MSSSTQTVEAERGSQLRAQQQLTSVRPLWRAPLEFVWHAFVGVCVFTTIAAAAVAISIVVHLLETQKFDPWLVFFLKVGEYGVLMVDVGLLLVFMGRAGLHTIDRLHEDEHRP